MGGYLIEVGQTTFHGKAWTYGVTRVTASRLVAVTLTKIPTGSPSWSKYHWEPTLSQADGPNETS